MGVALNESRAAVLVLVATKCDRYLRMYVFTCLFHMLVYKPSYPLDSRTFVGDSYSDTPCFLGAEQHDTYPD
jgi:hypothetical protein